MCSPPLSVSRESHHRPKRRALLSERLIPEAGLLRLPGQDRPPRSPQSPWPAPGWCPVPLTWAFECQADTSCGGWSWEQWPRPVWLTSLPRPRLPQWLQRGSGWGTGTDCRAGPPSGSFPGSCNPRRAGLHPLLGPRSGPHTHGWKPVSSLSCPRARGPSVGPDLESVLTPLILPSRRTNICVEPK